jgi:hypothetical protein
MSNERKKITDQNQPRLKPGSVTGIYRQHHVDVPENPTRRIDHEESMLYNHGSGRDSNGHDYIRSG